MPYLSLTLVYTMKICNWFH